MEIYEMRYFLGVARFENVHRASEELHVSPSSLSKAIGRLESELGVSLFRREGRNIRLTDTGRELQRKTSKIVALEEDTRLQLSDVAGSLNVDISAEEILQTEFGVEVARQIKDQHPGSKIHFLLASEKKVIQQLKDGDIHLGLITGDVPKGLQSKVLSHVNFKTCVGHSHPILKRYKTNSIIPVAAILDFDFVVPSFTMLGKLNTHVSLDGWRDDKFQRKIAYRACGLKVLEKLVSSGVAVAYLPEYFVAGMGAVALKVSGCPYKCQQKVKLVTRMPIELSWIRNIF